MVESIVLAVLGLLGSKEVLSIASSIFFRILKKMDDNERLMGLFINFVRELNIHTPIREADEMEELMKKSEEKENEKIKVLKESLKESDTIKTEMYAKNLTLENRVNELSKKRKKGISLHYTASKNPRAHNIETIRKTHKKRGFQDVGYHFLIRPNGTIDIGRPLNMTGAHTKGHNDKIGIALYGLNEFTDRQFETLAALIRTMRLHYDIKDEDIKGHGDWISDKDCQCPNFDVNGFKLVYLK